MALSRPFKVDRLSLPVSTPLSSRQVIDGVCVLHHRLPIQRGRVMNLPYEDRLCTKCSSADIGDEFDYVFSCPFFFFAESRKKISFTIFL